MIIKTVRRRTGERPYKASCHISITFKHRKPDGPESSLLSRINDLATEMRRIIPRDLQPPSGITGAFPSTLAT
jgi:hypothetical protein